MFLPATDTYSQGKRENNDSTRIEIGLVIAILILAAVLRMGWPGLTEFKADEARLTLRALEMVEGGGFPLRGISSSIGFPNFPMSVWLYALPLFVWPHVYSPTLFTGLLSTVAVFGCYWFVRRYWGVRAALIATLMFAVSPWVIHHSRKIWAQDLLPFFVIGWGISATLAFVEKRQKYIILHLLGLAIAIQVHFAAIALAPATLLMLFIFHRRVNWRLALAGMAVAALTTLPFAYYLSGQNVGVVAVLERAPDVRRGWDGQSWRYAWLLTSGQEIHALAGPNEFEAFLATVPDLTLAQGAWGMLALGGLGLLAWRAWQTRRKADRLQQSEAGLIVFIWFLVPVLFFTSPWLPVELHYLLTIYPAPYIAAGVLLTVLVRPWRAVGGATLGITVVAQLWLWARLLLFLSSHATPGGFGIPLAMQLEATSLAKRILVEEGAAEILIADEDPESEEFGVVYAVLLHDIPHRFVDVSYSVVFPAASALVFIESGTRAGSHLYRAAATRSETVPLRPGESSLQVLALPAAAAPVPGYNFESPQILANWASFFGYDAPILHEDGTATWHVYWNTGQPTSLDYHIFNHLVDAGGERVAQADAPVFAARQWLPGDIVISRARLPWPVKASESLTMRTGMYIYPGLESVLVFDAAGNLYTDAVEIPLP